MLRTIMPMLTLPVLALPVLALLLGHAAPAAAGEEDAGGVLNPEELSVAYYLDQVRRLPEFSGLVCWAGYEMHKAGDFAHSRPLFELCARHGHAVSMTFLAQMYENGHGVPRDLAEAGRWQRRAAETGHAAAQYNYGLALLRGHGVPCDPAAGRAWIARAADQGDADARALAAAGFRAADTACTPP